MIFDKDKQNTSDQSQTDNSTQSDVQASQTNDVDAQAREIIVNAKDEAISIKEAAE